MRRLSILLLVAVWLLPEVGPARAQASPDQMNKLSLEALTTPAPGGNPGSPGRRAYQRSFYRGLGRSHRRSSYGPRRYSYHPRSGYQRRGAYRSSRSDRRTSYHRSRSYPSYHGYRSHRTDRPRYVPAYHRYRRYR